MLLFLLSLLRRGLRFAALGLAGVSLVAFGFVGLGPHTGRYRTLTVLSGSMRPTMPEGSVAIVIPVPPAEIRPGDVITYNIPVGDRRVVTHRVVEIVEGGDHPVVRTQGDANAAPPIRGSPGSRPSRPGGCGPSSLASAASCMLCGYGRSGSCWSGACRRSCWRYG
ncbi:MAG: signal peptidase I [Actinomycetota bacterium]